MKLIFFDTETTGLDPKVHGIHQLAGEIVVDGKVYCEFDFRLRPFEGFRIDNKALEVSKTTRSDIYGYPKERAALFNLKCIMDCYICPNLNDKFFLAGWRVPEFDVKFLRTLFERHFGLKDFNSYFYTNPIDVKALASLYLLEERPQMANFSLAPVAKHLGVEVDESKLHTAAYDAYLSRKVYEIVTKR